ncbi:TPA: hypothetical protein NII69_000451 [Pseudomonas aeruginosa]|nr:hypothetical protein [Pseudomonas aeruginosa]
MMVFWQEGYAGATLRKLKAAMGGVCSPSLYAAYGSKEQLFMRSIAIYLREEMQPRWQVLQTGGVEAIRQFFRRSIQGYTTPSKPHGCLIDACLSEATNLSAEVHQILQTQRTETAQTLLACLDRALLNGELSTRIDPLRLTRLLTMFLSGLSSQARAGTPRDQLFLLMDDLLETTLLPRDSRANGRPLSSGEEAALSKSGAGISRLNLIGENIISAQAISLPSGRGFPDSAPLIQLLHRMGSVALHLCSSVVPTNHTWSRVNDKNKKALAIGKVAPGRRVLNLIHATSLCRQLHDR